MLGRQEELVAKSYNATSLRSSKEADIVWARIYHFVFVVEQEASA